MRSEVSEASVGRGQTSVAGGVGGGAVFEDGGWTYTLGEVLGTGGFATVFRATMVSGAVQRRVAIKVLGSEAAQDPEAVRRLHDEAAILGRLEHHAIVRVLGALTLSGRPAVVMDLVDGIDLRQILTHSALPPRAVCELGADVASALAAAWSDPDPQTGAPLQVIHRDIKPANILLSRRGAVRVVDLGVARASIERSGTTQSVHQLGTLRYMSPERFDGETSHRSDVFALAVTLVEALTATPCARLPVRPDRFAEARQAQLATVWALDAPPHWKIELVALLEEMLHYDERRRPEAAQVAARLTELADEAPGAGLRRVGPGLVAQAMAKRREQTVAETALPDPLSDGSGAPHGAASASLLGGGSGASSRSVPRSGMWVALAGLFMAVGGAVAWGVWPVNGPPEPGPPQVPHVQALAVDPAADVFIEASEELAPPPAARAAAAPPAPEAAQAPPPPESVEAIAVSFRVAAGAGGVVVVDSTEHALPARLMLAPGLHAVTFQHDGVDESKMIYVGEAAARRYVFDASMDTVYAFD